MPTLEERVADAIANMPRPMPDNFAPKLWVEEGNRICVYARRHFGERHCAFGFGFILTDDPETNGKAMKQLWRSLWEALEMVRLDRTKELRASGILDGNPIEPPR